jgi:hypothetical protein
VSTHLSGVGGEDFVTKRRKKSGRVFTAFNGNFDTNVERAALEWHFVSILGALHYGEIMITCDAT